MATMLTERAIWSLRPTAVRREIADKSQPGLRLIQQPSGALSWAVRFRYGGRPKKVTLGPYEALSLGEARKRAAKAAGPWPMVATPRPTSVP